MKSLQIKTGLSLSLSLSFGVDNLKRSLTQSLVPRYKAAYHQCDQMWRLKVAQFWQKWPKLANIC